ncbi:uncharacterized protein LOC124167502 [Ischnura elegans]|uniref:uncharacterized protein LOC124167502 n=1 Tax=Ischnura elegans TaxID=197161 RepID=UPI001ED8A56D|nr:uncharacterized protein LOC124167502 [Ischnura elegans]
MENLSRCISKERVLESVKNFTGRPNVKLLDGMEILRATKGVEGLTSIVIRVKTPYCFSGDDGKILWKTFIVKALPENLFQLDVVERCRLFVKEVIFFKEIVPLLSKAAAAGNVSLPLPKCFFAAGDGGSDSIYLEDLSEAGYKIPDSTSFTVGLDLDHSSLVMKTLGKFHAITYAAEKLLLPSKNWVAEFPVFSRDSIFYDPIGKDVVSPLFPLVKSCVETFVTMSSQMNGLPKQPDFTGALTKALENNWPNLCRLVQPDPQGFNVLSHGDCWINNAMFLYDGGRPVDLKIIDFQISRYCHPAVDIFYFMYLCTRREFRDKNLHSLVLEYYNSLVYYLSVLGFDVPPITLDKLKEDLVKYRAFGIAINSSFTPTMLLGEDFMPSNSGELSVEQLRDLYDTGNSSALLKKFKSDPTFRSRMETLIREFVDWAIPQ